MTDEEHDFFLPASTEILDFFHFQNEFIIFSSFPMCFYHIFQHFNIFFKKNSFKVLSKYLMSNLTHGYDSYGSKKNTQVQILKIDKQPSPWN
jgi:hypothetical protein